MLNGLMNGFFSYTKSINKKYRYYFIIYTISYIYNEIVSKRNYFNMIIKKINKK